MVLGLESSFPLLSQFAWWCVVLVVWSFHYRNVLSFCRSLVKYNANVSLSLLCYSYSKKTFCCLSSRKRGKIAPKNWLWHAKIQIGLWSSFALCIYWCRFTTSNLAFARKNLNFYQRAKEPYENKEAKGFDNCNSEDSFVHLFALSKNCKVQKNERQRNISTKSQVYYQQKAFAVHIQVLNFTPIHSYFVSCMCCFSNSRRNNSGQMR